MASEDIIWLTQTAVDRLEEELKERTGPLRNEITEKIAAAREEGDLKENGGYHAAKDEQGKNEARIRELQHILSVACVKKLPEHNTDIVAHGSVVTVEFSDGMSEVFLLGSREELATASINVVSTDAPLGAAVLHSSIGSDVSYMVPSGKTLTVKIIDVRPYLKNK